jgi:hypothetical protein
MRVVLALITAALAGTAAAQAPPTVPPDATAIVRDQPIPRADYDRTLAQTRRSYARSNRPFPDEGTVEFERVKQGIVDFLVLRAMFEVKAREPRVTLSEAEVEQRIAQIKRQYFDSSERRLPTWGVSKPFRTRFGWHVVQALAPVKPGRTQSLSEIRGRIRSSLLQTRRNDAMASFVAAMKLELAAETAYAPGFEPGG